MVQTIVLNDAGRLQLIDMVLRQLEASGDERAPEAIAEYERQRAEVVARIQAGGQGVVSNQLAVSSAQADGRPPAQVVGMQTVELRGN